MALLVLDTSKVSIGKAPGDGFSMNLSEIEGFPPGLMIMIPFESEYAVEVHDAIAETLGKGKPHVDVASPADIARVQRAS